MSRVIIIGGVAGGMSAAARLRRNDENTEIIVFEKGEYISYANCGLPYYIGGVIKDRQKLLVQTVDSFRSRFRADVRTRHEVLKIDPKSKTVLVRDLSPGGNESVEHYDKLVRSPGAEPVRPALPGIDHPRIFTLRTIPDTDRIREFLDKNNPRRAVIVGGGYIGLEMAENLHRRGIFVTLVEMANQVMTPIDFEMAAVVHQHLRARKVEFYLGSPVASFADDRGRIAVRLENGLDLTGDMAILAIGVRPDTRLAREAGLSVGGKGGITVNEFLQTSNPDIYAIGDAVEIVHPVTRQKMVLPLAGPANKEGRIVADNIAFGNRSRYTGTYGSSIAKVFDLTVGATGANEKMLASAGIPHQSVIIHPNAHASYYPDSLQMSLKILFSPAEGRLLGAQAVGYDGVDKRLDVLAAVLQKGGSVSDLTEIEHLYAPPYSSAKDPVNMAGFVAENVLTGKVKTVTWDELSRLDAKETFLLDVRTPEEVRMGTIPGSVNIPLDSLRDRLNLVPRSRHIVVFCRVGLRGYLAARILTQSGYAKVSNLSGGFVTYSAAAGQQDLRHVFDESYDMGVQPSGAASGAAIHPAALSVHAPGRTVDVDATGMQCPGPIMKLKSEMDKVSPGDRLSVRSTDPGFYNDVPSWTKATGHILVSLNSEKGVVNAVVEKAVPKSGGSAGVASGGGGNDKTIIVFDGELDKAIASFIIANGALSMGRKVTMFFTFWGLNVLRKPGKVGGLKKNIVEKMFGMMLPRGSLKLPLSSMNMGGMGPKMIRWLMKKKKVESLENMVKAAIAGGGRLIACQMSMDLMGIRAEELIEGVEIGGVATYLECAEHADTNLFI